MKIKLGYTGYSVTQDEFIKRYLKTLCYSDGETISIMSYDDFFKFIREMKLCAHYDCNNDVILISSEWYL